ncbi:peptidoglycan recognition protein [Streptomyces sp. NPDC059373]
MRAFLASAVGVACMTALAVPFVLPDDDATATAHHASPDAARAAVAGSTWTLPLSPVARSAVRAVDAQRVKPFSLLGVTWNDATAEIHGTVQVRTRSVRTGVWSDWQDVEAHTDDTPDVGSPEETAPGVRGATAPLWVGDSDGVQVRVNPTAVRGRAAGPPLPAGLRLDMIDPGEGPDSGYDDSGYDGYDDGYDGYDPTDGLTGESPADADNNNDQPSEQSDEGPAEPAVIPPASKEETAAETGRGPYIGARPRIITRSGWGADEKLRERKFVYTKTVKVVFVHHSATGNNYTCDEADAVVRSIYRYHVRSSHWRDIGYNFLVDKCGNIYEGRAGGVTKAVYGAHTLGFNSNSMGVAVLGTYNNEQPSDAALRAISQLAAWKLGLFGRNPGGTATLLSGGSNKYRKGIRVRFKVISGHRDGFRTECPGDELYDDLGVTRRSAADLQGR